MKHYNRRQFLASAGAATVLGGTGALSSLVSRRAFAADPADYKALVCVFLYGGMDHGDTVLPYDTPSYDALANLRPFGGEIGFDEFVRQFTHFE